MVTVDLEALGLLKVDVLALGMLTAIRKAMAMAGVKKLYESGVLGTVARIQQSRNGTQPYWYGYRKPEAKKA